MATKPKRISTRSVLATYLGWDASELSDYRYNYGRTSCPVYTIGDDYYCCVLKGKKPAAHREVDERWAWVKIEDPYAESQGCEIYVHDEMQADDPEN